MGLPVTLGTTGTRGVSIGAALDRLGPLRHGRGHQRRVERVADRQRHDLGGVGGQAGQPVQRRGRTGDDHVSRRVLQPDHERLRRGRGQRGQLLDPLDRQAHRPRASRP